MVRILLTTFAVTSCAASAPSRMSWAEVTGRSGDDAPPERSLPTDFDPRAWPQLRAALDRFRTAAAQLRADSPVGSPMPSAHVAAWNEVLTVVETAADMPLAKASVLDAMRARLTLEDELNADGHTFGDVEPSVVERAQAALKALTVKVSRLTWAERPRMAEMGPLGLSWPLWPIQITSPFGARKHPISGQAKQHHGLDVLAVAQQPIIAAAAGTVLFAGWNGAHGKQVEVLHDEHTTTSYSHLDTLLVETGSDLKRGQLVGLAGQTGRATGVHLHFEIRRDGEAIDPMTVMPSPYETPTEADVR